MVEAAITTFRGRPAVRIQSDRVKCVILMGGGHIASLSLVDEGMNVLWEPRWPTVDPSVRGMIDPAIYGEGPEAQLLSSIAGLNLCVDVFGAHSPGEVRSGLSFHGEAGMVTWFVEKVEQDDNCCTLSMSAELPHARLRIDRDYTLRQGTCHIDIEERVINLVGFERAMGRSQHLTLGGEFLEGGATWTCNADRGLTMQSDDLSSPEAFASLAEFDYPSIPLAAGGHADWTRFPRIKGAGGICTLRIRPNEQHGYFVALNQCLGLAVAARWPRKDFPWMVTWDENCSRQRRPWNGATLARGIEFSSYALPTSRRENVARGTLFDTPCFEWLDAYEQKTTSFTLAIYSTRTGQMPEISDVFQGGGYVEGDSRKEKTILSGTKEGSLACGCCQEAVVACRKMS